MIGAGRRYKNHPRITAYSAIDEAGAAIGLALSDLRSDPGCADVARNLESIQQVLWAVGADLSRVHDTVHAYRTPETAAADLDPVIDRYQAELPPIGQFILRGGIPAGAAP